MRVETEGGELLGYVWGEWADVNLMRFHVCAREGARLPFFRSDLLDQLVLMAFWLGADVIDTRLDDHPNPKPIERLLKSLGFAVSVDDHGTSFTTNTRTYLGLQRPVIEQSGPNPDQR